MNSREIGLGPTQSHATRLKAGYTFLPFDLSDVIPVDFWLSVSDIQTFVILLYKKVYPVMNSTSPKPKCVSLDYSFLSLVSAWRR